MDRANNIFDQTDTDQSGGLDKGEITIHLLALGQEQETVMEMFALLDADNDGLISREEFVNGFQKYQEFCKLSAKRMAQGLDLDLRLDVVHGLEPHDFTGLWHQKLGAHLPGTREWAFKEVFAWLDAAPTDAAQLFWLMGGGGVGKSVLTAELLHRAYRSNRVVAWHFCRHDNPQQSSPDALLQSLAAMLCTRLPGYKEALGEVSAELLKSTDPKELFAALFTAPLQKVKDPETPSLIILDALDELPKEGQRPLLSVIAAQLSTLPKWLRLFVTSREEPQIKVALARFKPKELRADEAKNRADVEVRCLAPGSTACFATLIDILTMALLTMDVVLTMTVLAVALLTMAIVTIAILTMVMLTMDIRTVAIPAKLYWLYRLWFYLLWLY